MPSEDPWLSVVEVVRGGPGNGGDLVVCIRDGECELARRRFLRVQCPTLVMGGEDDPMVPIECQADIAAALPAHLVRFEHIVGCGHAVLPDARERAMSVIRDFIAEEGHHG